MAAPEKDVDRINPVNVGWLTTGNPGFAPCTPAGVRTMLDSETVGIEGRHSAVAGRGNIVGGSMAMPLHNTLSAAEFVTASQGVR